MKQEKAVYTRGPIGKTMVLTALSMLAGTLAMSGYNIVDTYFVSRLGKIPLAGMGFSFPVIMLIGCVFRGLSIGVMTTAAQAIGRGKRNKAAVLVTSGILLIVLFSFLLAILGMSTGRLAFTLMGASGEALNQVIGYMDIWYFGCVTASLGMAGNDLLISAGSSKSASLLMVAGLLLNAVLDPLFIFGYGPIPEMGIRGAALATVIAQLFSAVAVLTILYRRLHLLRFVRIPLRQLRSSWNIIIRFAVPSSIGMLMMPIGSTIITWITARFGDTAVAATAAAGRLEMAAFIFPMALGISLLPMIGQNFGARLYSRIRACQRFSMRFAFLFLLGMAVIYYFFAGELVAFFSPDPEVQKVMTLCMHIIPWGFGMIEIHRFGGFFYTGCGRPSVAAFLNGLRILGLMVPFSFLALYFDSLAGLFWARLAADVIAGTVAWLMARHLVRRLPEDGMALPPHEDKGGFLRYLTVSRLKGVAVAQAEIDSSSHTQ